MPKAENLRAQKARWKQFIRNIPRGRSDHNVVTMRIRIKGNNNPAREVLARDRREFNEDMFKNKIRDIDWTDLYDIKEVNAAYGMFEERFLNILDNMAPVKKSQIRNKVTLWISIETKVLMTERDRVRNNAAVSNQEEEWTSYRALRNKCSSSLEKDRKSYLGRKYESFENDNNIKGPYKLLKNQMGWKQAGPPTAFRQDDQIIRKP